MLDPRRDPRFGRMIHGNARMETLWTGGRWCEGPAYLAAGRYLIWSDIPNDRLMRWDEMNGAVSTFLQPCRNQNGHTVDREGRLLCCEHRGRQVSRIEHDGTTTVLASNFKGKSFNSPNDVVVKSDGTIWFTDPSYGIMSDYEGHKADMEQDGCYVFRFDPKSGKLTVVADDFDKPNGLAFSPDESLLYVADSASAHEPEKPRHIRAFKVQGNNTLKGVLTFQGGQVVDSATQVVAAPTTTGGTSVTELHWVKPSGWPVGDYTVEIWLDGQSAGTRTLTVKR